MSLVSYSEQSLQSLRSSPAEVQVAGLTLEEASKKIKEIYGKYIKNPELGP